MTFMLRLSGREKLSRGAMRPRFACVPRNKRGSRECRVRAAPAVSCAKLCKRNAHEHRYSRRHSGIPRAMALRLISRSPRRRIRLVTVIGGLKVSSRPVGPAKTSADLTPATGARTTRFCRTLWRRSSAHVDRSQAFRPTLRSRRAPDAAASTASRPNVRDDGQRPSLGDEMARLIVLICPTGEAESFSGEDWTGQITLKDFGKFVAARSDRMAGTQRYRRIAAGGMRGFAGSAHRANQTRPHQTRDVGERLFWFA
jgi:hypothetical protein